MAPRSKIGDDPVMLVRCLAVVLAGLAVVLGTLLVAPGAAAAAPRTWRFVALGDSIPYGGSYCGFCTPYPALLGSALLRQSGHPVSVRDLGIPGLTTAQLLANVRSRADVREAVAAADVVTITIGHNDTPWNSRHDSCDGAHAWFGPYHDAQWTTYTGPCLTREADALGFRLRSILSTVRSLRAGRPTLIELTTDWNQLIGEAGIGATPRAASKAVLDRFAAVTCAAARAYGARCGDAYHAFNGTAGLLAGGTYLAADHDHASQRGHREIASILAAFGFTPLAK
jgi:lysophospholipase L1-like esterase